MQHMVRRFRQLLALAVMAAVPRLASAQFTTFIPPKPRAVDSAVAKVAAVQKAKADSVAQAHVTTMQTWVDSAAGLVAPSIDTAAVDTLNRTTMNAIDNAADTTVAFRNGARAPATASDLPLLAALGLGMLGLGALLLATGRPARACSEDRRRGRV